jgi:hypothetical protein
MPAPLHVDAVSYLKQQGLPVTTNSLNRTMGLLQQQPNLRPSYSGQEVVDVDPDTMSPVLRGGLLPPLQNDSNTNSSFGQAFAAARKKLGPGQVFDWNGKKYTTDYKEEVGGKPSPSKTSGDDIAEGDPINREAESEMRNDLLNEKLDLDTPYEGNEMKLTRGNYSDVAQADDGMENLLAAVLGGGAIAGGAALAGARGQSKPPRQMTRGDLYTPDKPKDNVMTDEDLYGKRPQQMTDSDIFTGDEQIERMMTQEDLTGNQKMQDQDFLKGVEADEMALDDERAAAKAIRTRNKIMAKKLLPRLENLNDVDPRLIKMLKGLL